MRTKIFEWGGVPISFERLAICLDNIPHLTPDLVISGSLPIENTFRFINALKMRCRRLPVVIISADEAVEEFIRANRFLNVRVFKTDFDPLELKAAIAGAPAIGPDPEGADDGPMIIGNNPDIIEIKKKIPELSRLSETVFIQGEKGAGREHIARAIHMAPGRESRSFIKLNIEKMNHAGPMNVPFDFNSTAPGDGRRPSGPGSGGAAGKTIFLDDVGRATPETQAALFRILESRGGLNDRGRGLEPARDRFIASRGPHLGRLVAAGRFRKDLFYRLNVIKMKIPPLRKRREDIPLLTDFFLDKACMELGMGHYSLPPKIEKRFFEYAWPGNVDELEKLIQKAVIHGHDKNIFGRFAPLKKHRGAASISDCVEEIYYMTGLNELKPYVRDLNKTSLKKIRGEFTARAEKKLLKRVLQKTRGNRKEAATILNISYKSCLSKMKAYGLS